MASIKGNGHNILEEALRKAEEERVRELQRAEEERAKERRRNEINGEISQLNTKKNDVYKQIYNLTSEQTHLNMYLEEWGAQKALCNQNDILSEIVILNVFEGVCADKIKQEFHESVAEMDLTCRKIVGLYGGVSVQIERLNQYASIINTRLTSLRNELNSL